MTGQYNACEVYAKCFNQHNVSELIDLLAEDMVYTSHWVFEAMHGRERVATYLMDKIQAIKNDGAQVVMDIAECAVGHAVVAFQHQVSTDAAWLERPKAVMLIATNQDGLITSMHMTEYSFAHVVNRLQIYPGWAGVNALIPNDQVVLTKCDYQELELCVLLLNGEISLDQRMLAEVAIVKDFLPGVNLSVHVFQTLMDMRVTQLIMQSSINGFPAIIATVRGHIVWHATGLLKGEDIAKRTQQVLTIRRVENTDNEGTCG